MISFSLKRFMRIVEVVLPLKQGLKLLLLLTFDKIYVVEVVLPLKQGLKQGSLACFP